MIGLYVTLPLNVGRPFCLNDVIQWLHAYTGTIPIVSTIKFKKST